MIDKKTRGNMTLAEHDAMLKAEGKWDEYQAMLARKEEDRKLRKAELSAAQAPLVADLRQLRINVDSVWDLVNSASPYPEAVPVLFDHLNRPYPERVMEGILRALAVPASRSGWAMLLHYFESAPTRDTGGLRWAAGCALNAAADDEVISDVIRIVGDTRYGFDRAAMIPALVRSADERARHLLRTLRDDPVLGKEIRRTQRR